MGGSMLMGAVNGVLDRPFMAPLKKRALDLATDYRGWLILFVALPLSFLFETYYFWRSWVYETFYAAPQLHEERVAFVQAQVREWARRKAAGEKLGKMCTDRSPLMTMSPATRTFKKDCCKIQCSMLKDILELNTEKMTVRLEPLVNMGCVVRSLLPKGYALAIQVEMEDLTIGGLTMGLGMETNCHKLGLMQENVVSYDIVLANGDLVKATRDNKYQDLFFALPWSCGTLGFLVAVEVKIIKVAKYMHMTYLPTYTQDEHCKKMYELSCAKDAPDFLESTIYSKHKAVIQIGRLTDDVPAGCEVNGVNYWYKPWYYKWVEEAFDRRDNEKGSPGFAECIPLKHYYHRYTRSIFWELGDLIPFSNQLWYRVLFGWLGAPKVSFLKLTLTPEVRESVMYQHVVQDVIVPINNMKEAHDLFHEEFEIYPLLVFPIRIYDNGPDKPQGMLRRPVEFDGEDGPNDHLPGQKWQMFFDLGAYGIPEKIRQKKPWDAIKSILRMEKMTRDMKGYQCFYADMLATREEYQEMFDHTLYFEVRKKYGAADAFPEVYDKVVPEIDFRRKGDKKKA